WLEEQGMILKQTFWDSPETNVGPSHAGRQRGPETL
ncbi:LIG1 isoform 10, partial [Pongo abelii]